MLVYELTDLLGDRVTIRLDVTDPDVSAGVCFEGRREAVRSVRRLLMGAPGVRGRFVGPKTTARHLAHAMAVDPLLSRCRPRITAGAAILQLPIRGEPPP
ncbi:MAG: hypothetical protein AAFN74_03250 [Myxococcota bacterium]